MKSIKSTVTVTAKDKARILADHEKDMRQNPKGVQQIEFPKDVWDKLCWLADQTGYSLNDCIIGLLRVQLPVMMEEHRAKAAMGKWLRQSPAWKQGGAL
jgi:hypothetical protein